MACAVIGLLLALAYRETMIKAPDTLKTRAALVKDVRAQVAQTQDRQAQADRLRAEVTADQAELLAQTANGQQDSARLHLLEGAVGAQDVHGPGIEVTLGDGPVDSNAPTDSTAGANPGLVVDRDLQRLVNALWESGAEAIAINNQRLAPTTTIRSVGQSIQVDQQVVFSPYHLLVIGDPNRLEVKFAESSAGQTFANYRQTYGMKFSVRRARNLLLPAAGQSTLHHASPGPGPSSARR